jgi:hypothetical protein
MTYLRPPPAHLTYPIPHSLGELSIEWLQFRQQNTCCDYDVEKISSFHHQHETPTNYSLHTAVGFIAVITTNHVVFI